MKKTVQNKLRRAIALLAAATITSSVQAYQGMPTPKLHVNGRHLQDPTGKNVLLHGYMQPGDSYFNGGHGVNFNNPTDYTSTANVASALNYYRSVATLMTDTAPRYGRTHGWYSSFVRYLADGTGVHNFAPGWNSAGQLASPAQFNGWINNVLVPYVNHCRSVGLYVVLCGNPSEVFPGGDAGKNMTQQYQQNLITFWTTVANHPSIKSADNVMFEICNEPIAIETAFGRNDWGQGPDAYDRAITAFMQPIVNAIRNTGADNVIWIPGLVWQGQYDNFATYPVTGSNIGYAGHLYPQSGSLNDPNTFAQVWNGAFKACADRYPMIITEMAWHPGDSYGLINGTTAGFGMNAKNTFDASGNINYVCGMIGDMLGNLQNGLANHTFPTKESGQAAFAWWPTYTWAAPSNGGSIADGTYRIVARHSGKALDAYGAQTANGTQIIQWTYGGGSNQRWTVTNRGNNQYSIIGVQSGKAVEVSAWGTANGTKVQLWDWLNGSNQKHTFTATSGGYYRITPTHATGSCLDVAGVSTADGALVHLWQWLNGNNQQWAFQAP